MLGRNTHVGDVINGSTVIEVVRGAAIIEHGPADFQVYRSWRVASRRTLEGARRLAERTATTPSELANCPIPGSAGEAEGFLRRCLEALGGGFHPDTYGAEYQDQDGSPTFTVGEAAGFDLRLQAVFDLIADPYLLTMEVAS